MTTPLDELTSAQADLVARARTVAQEELRPRAAEWDQRAEFPEEQFQLLRAAGLTALTVPVEYGGQGLGTFEACLVLEELAAGCLASAMTIQMQVNGPPRVIARIGTEQQRNEYLPRVADGSVCFSIAMTEPQAGSDGTALTTTLTPDGDGFRLTGDKCHITGALRSDAFLVFCRAPDTTGPDGIGCVLVDRDVEGLQPIETEPKMGGRAIAEGIMAFRDCPVRADQVVLAPEKGSRDGARFLIRQFNPERCGNAAMSIGLARSALDDAIAYVKQREQFGRPIVEFQGLQWKLADMATAVDGARLLLWRAARTDVQGFPGIRETAMAKLAANEAALMVTSEALQLLGHKGYLTRYPMERYVRDAFGLGIGGGTTGVLRNLIAGEVTGVRVNQRRT
ncbi:acyl-CoA dehydrogenase family protein [Pseudonocardia sp. WMMC193]|uniref:acyl-CoA dehydrogenase family protein n=1 Tax=Pseudonocardia sp. WMMC193 TaxID=2911965 RepID=UPI001F22849E|nr:acyl-CoA dehydrogenase family protein [Pseudonocardia sp. WMMC193]MCF7550793.1 acyl-CoA dehydrogenase family protein [Pseudonocardia sp. WMMC193]